MTSSHAWSETTHKIAGCDVCLARAGKGRPILLLHHDTGTLERLPFYDSLAEKFDVLGADHALGGRRRRSAEMR